MMHYGCVIFDDPHVHAAAYAASSSADRPKPFRVAGTGDLASDHVWITNLDYSLSWESGLSRHSRFRRSDFLRRSIDVITDGFGVGSSPRLIANPQARAFLNSLRKRALQMGPTLDAGSLAASKAMIVARVFERVMRLTALTLDFDYIPQSRLAIGVRQVIAPPDITIPEWVGAAVEDAIGYSTFCERIVTNTPVDLYWFRVPPALLAQRALRGIFPASDAEWTRIPSPSDAMVRDTIELNAPFLARITVLSTAAQVNRLINYGSGAIGKQSRQWVSGTELYYMMDISDIKIHEILVPSKGDPQSPIFSWLQNEDRRLTLSASAGVFVENLWSGLAARTDRARPNVRAPFVYGAIKTECLNAAIHVQRAGGDVDRYGMGSVVVRIPSTREGALIDKVAKIAHDAQLLPPAMGIKIDKALALFGNETPLALMQSLSIAGDPLQMFEIDAQAIERIEQNAAEESGTDTTTEASA